MNDSNAFPTFRYLLDDLYNRELPIEGSHFNQTARNALRDELLTALCSDFNSLSIEAYRVEKGLALNVQSDIEGSITVLVNVSLPNLDYDIDEENEAWLDRQAKAAAKQEASKKKKKTNA